MEFLVEISLNSLGIVLKCIFEEAEISNSTRLCFIELLRGCF